MPKTPIQYFNRYTKTLETESVYGEAWLKWIYGNPLGKLSAIALFKRGYFSRWYGRRMSHPNSKKRVLPFIRDYKMNAQDFKNAAESYVSFNDFFIRELKPAARPIDLDPKSIVFPVDGRHLGFQDISKIKSVFVKGQTFDLKELLQSSTLAEKYKNGSLVLSRLCPTDYHRFHFPTDGFVGETKLINGPLDSVNPIALRQNIKIFSQNKRTITQLKTKGFGDILLLEIGASCVGSILQTYQPNTQVEKGEEKGYFSFGGSSTIMIFEQDAVQLSLDLLENTQKSIELYARMGDYLSQNT